MRFLALKFFKTIVIFGAMVFFVSCTNEVGDTTAGLIDNNNFIKDTLLVTPVLTTNKVDTVRTGSLSNYLLGDYTNTTLGDLKTSVIGQITPYETSLNNTSVYPLVRTENTDLESIITSDVTAVLEIPLNLVAKSDGTEGLEIFNFTGDINTTLNIEVNTFTTYLEEFNADGSLRIYYSDGTNKANEKQNLGTETLLGSKSGVQFLASYTEADTLKIPLSAYDFKDNFIALLDDENIDASQAFKSFFQGLKISTTKTSGTGCVVPFDSSKTRLKITYTNTDADGTSSDEEMYFRFDDAYYSVYNHTHTANTADNSKVYVQGAGGYEVVVDLQDVVSSYSTNANSENWLINQAKLKVYVDDVTDNTLSSYYIYGVKSDKELFILNDYATFGVSNVDGVLRYEDAETKTNPYIQFFITDYIKQVLADGEIDELRIKSKEALEGTSINLSSTNPKHVVLLNDVSSETKAPVLELIYSKTE